MLKNYEQAKNNRGSASDANVTASFYWETQHDVARESWEFLAQNCVLVHFNNLLRAAGETLLYLDNQHVCGDNWHDGNRNNFRTIEAQIVQKLKNNRRGLAKIYWFL